MWIQPSGYLYLDSLLLFCSLLVITILINTQLAPLDFLFNVTLWNLFTAPNCLPLLRRFPPLWQTTSSPIETKYIKKLCLWNWYRTMKIERLPHCDIDVLSTVNRDISVIFARKSSIVWTCRVFSFIDDPHAKDKRITLVLFDKRVHDRSQPGNNLNQKIFNLLRVKIRPLNYETKFDLYYFRRKTDI